jgi:hypothetical protein
LRPLLRRNDFGAGLVNGESVDGGLEEFCEFIPSRRLNSTFSASSMASRAVSRSTMARSSTFSAASSSYDGRDSAGTTPSFALSREDQHDTPIESQKSQRSHQQHKPLAT